MPNTVGPLAPSTLSEPHRFDLSSTTDERAVLLVKDADTHPTYKPHFTRALDAVLDPRAPVSYWDGGRVRAMLESLGVRVYRHKCSMFFRIHMSFLSAKKG